jgi:hypothetical protein
MFYAAITAASSFQKTLKREKTSEKRESMMPDDNSTTMPAEPNPAISQFSAFVGVWQTEASVGGQLIGRGRTVFTWLEGGAFLAQRVEIEDPSFPASIGIIGLDEGNDVYCQLYADSRGVSRIYQMGLKEGVWTLTRQAPGFSQRFVGTFSPDGRGITGRWEKSSDGSNWEHDFDLIYTKVS